MFTLLITSLVLSTLTYIWFFGKKDVQRIKKREPPSPKDAKETDGIPFYDVLVIGCGISGIGAAATLQKDTTKSFRILERRATFGGTWDLFKYPGIRLDSSMRTFAYSFYPWLKRKSFLTGQEMKDYLKEVMEVYELDQHVSYNEHVISFSFDSSKSVWTVKTTTGSYQSNFVFSAAGYYDHDAGYMPEYPGVENFKGEIIHPQAWNSTVDYKDKDVIIIGSGATAITMAPNMAGICKSLSVLQRSPSYMFELPLAVTIIPGLSQLCDIFPTVNWFVMMAIKLFEVTAPQILFFVSRIAPNVLKKFLMQPVHQAVPDDTEHFTPTYDPWDQRVCCVPDGDLFKAINEKKITMVTDTIKSFTSAGILLNSGRELKADLIVSATGFNLSFLGKASLFVDGKEKFTSDSIMYRGCMLSDVPNFWYGFGSINNSWTLKLCLVYSIFSRMINHMEEQGYKEIKPVAQKGLPTTREFGLTSSYIKRGKNILPQCSTEKPWNVVYYYMADWFYTKTLNVQESQDLEYN